MKRDFKRLASLCGPTRTVSLIRSRLLYRVQTALFVPMIVAAASLSACTGFVRSDGDSSGSEYPGPGTSPDDGSSPTSASSGLPPTGMLKLTTAQVRNTLRELLGPNVPVPGDLDPDIVAGGFTTIGARTASSSERGVEALERAALAATASVFADPALRMALVKCTPDVASDACARGFLKELARRAFRTSAAMVDEGPYLQVYSQVLGRGDDPWRALEFAASSVLQSPRLVFRVEEGAAEAGSATRRRYLGHEMASRLAFFLWNSAPDDALLSAADAGLLDEASGVETQALRLLESPKARDGLMAFLREKFEIQQYDSITKDGTAFPNFSRDLIGPMKDETDLVLQHVFLDTDSDALDILDTRTTFIGSRLAKLYGLTDVTSVAPIQLTLPLTSQRLGILGHSGFLAAKAHTDSTSPTRRGKFVRERLLCGDVPAPPDNAITALPADPTGNLTQKEKLEVHRTDPTCAACHDLMDPLGLSLENFDGLGQWRDMDKSAPISVAGTINGSEYADFPGFVARLRSDPATTDCFAREAYRYAMAHRETDAEEPRVESLTKAFQNSGRRLRTLVVLLVTSDAFRYGAVPQ